MNASSAVCIDGRLNIHIHRVVYFQQKIARILHAPLHVWNHEMRGCGVLAARLPHLKVQRQFMIVAVEFEDAVYIYLRGALLGKFAIDMVGCECSLGVALAL